MSPPAVRWPWPWQWRELWRLLHSPDEAVRREAWGYAFWIPAVVLLFLPAELIPAFWNAAHWPTFSTTIGHLEYLWGPTALFVIALMVFTAVNAVQRKRRERAPRHGAYRDDVDGGRIVRHAAADHDSWVDMRIYLPGSAATIAAFAAIAFVFGGYWPGAYVLWGLVAFFVLVLPSVLAWRFAKHVLFPTLFRTVANLESHVQMIGTAVLAFLAALALHLSLYPWPNTSHVLQTDHRIAPSVAGDAVKGGTVTVSGTVENCVRAEKVVVRSPVFAGELAVPVDGNGHYSVKVKLVSSPAKDDAVSVYCGRSEVGITALK